MLDPDSLCFRCFWHNQCLLEQDLGESEDLEYVNQCISDEEDDIEFTPKDDYD